MKIDHKLQKAVTELKTGPERKIGVEKASLSQSEFITLKVDPKIFTEEASGAMAIIKNPRVHLCDS